MAPLKLAYGLNLPNKKPQQNTFSKATNLAAGQKRKKTIFDSDSDDDARSEKRSSGRYHNRKNDEGVEITSFGGLKEMSPSQKGEPGGSRSSRAVPGKKKRVDALNKKSIFPDGDDDNDGNDNADYDNNDNDNDAAAEAADGDKTRQNSQPRFIGTGKDYTNLAALYSSNKHANAAQEIDPSVYSYDAIYDSIHAKKNDRNTSTSGEGPRSRYMDSLLRSAEIRKRDQLRAKDRLLAREREAEGDEFADKEKFVTGAYRAQQEEIRQIEEEEARREREEEERRKRNGGTGMVGFYREMLTREDAQHAESMKAAQDAAQKVQTGETATEKKTEGREAESNKKKENTEAELAAKLNAQGAGIIVNDEGQVVDKRQLLNAGLNIVQKRKPSPALAKSRGNHPDLASPSYTSSTQARNHTAAQLRARQTEMLATQLEEQARREDEAEIARQREIAERSRSRKTAADVSSARERYLARKREREQEQTTAKAKDEKEGKERA